MVSERLKTELADLRTKMLDIREFNEFSPEHFQCVCESLKNIQSMLIEIVNQTEMQSLPAHQNQQLSEDTKPSDGSHSPTEAHQAAAR